MKICDEFFILGEEKRLYRRQFFNPETGISKISEFYDSDSRVMFRHVFFENGSAEGSDGRKKRLFFMKRNQNTAVYYDRNNKIIIEVKIEKNGYTVKKYNSLSKDEETTTNCSMENTELIFYDEDLNNFHVKLWHLTTDETGKTIRMISGETREDIEYTEEKISKKRIYHHNIYQYSVKYEWKDL